MANYPYVLTPEKLNQFLGRLKTSGRPAKVNKQYLASLGYTSSNHRPFPMVLKFIGLIDNNGVPTDRYQALRDSQGGPALVAQYLQEAYSELFKLYPDAYRKDDEALINFFRAHTGLGDRAVSAIVATFQVLCQFADFRALGQAAVPQPERYEQVAEAAEPVSPPPATAPSVTLSPVVINVNLQLELPSTSDPEVYKALFAAMAEHIFRLAKE